MLILQTDDLARDRARLERLGVRLVWQADYPDIRAVHLHPKDIGAAIVSLDQPVPPESWRWAGPHWRQHISPHGAQQVLEATIGAIDPDAMARRWADVLGTPPPADRRISLAQGGLRFAAAPSDRIVEYSLRGSTPLPAARTHKICGTRFSVV
jgi:hypothetical protein